MPGANWKRHPLFVQRAMPCSASANSFLQLRPLVHSPVLSCPCLLLHGEVLLNRFLQRRCLCTLPTGGRRPMEHRRACRVYLPPPSWPAAAAPAALCPSLYGPQAVKLGSGVGDGAASRLPPLCWQLLAATPNGSAIEDATLAGGRPAGGRCPVGPAGSATTASATSLLP